MLAIAGPGREASKNSTLLFTEAALPFAGCQCLCLPAGPAKHQELSLLSNALSSGPCTSSSQGLEPQQVHQAIKTAPNLSLPSLTFWVQPRTRLGLLRLHQAWENTRWQTPFGTRVKANKGTVSTFLHAKSQSTSAMGCLASFLLLLPAASCSLLLPASCCFLPLAASMTGQYLWQLIAVMEKLTHLWLASRRTDFNLLPPTASSVSPSRVCPWLPSGRGP